MVEMLSNQNSSELSLMLEPDVIKAKFHISEEELESLRRFGENYKNDIKPFLDEFYGWMQSLPEFPKFFSNSAIVERVKSQQANYWIEFFSGNISKTYLRNRVHIGAVHAEIGLPIHSYCAAMNYSTEWWKDKIEEFRYSKGENKEISVEASRVTRILHKLIQLDVMLVTETYHKKTQEKLADTLGKTKNIIQKVTKVAREVLDGNYDIQLDDDQHDDGLNKVINKMISELKHSSEETKRDSWLKEGVTELASQLRGDQKMSELCSNAIGFITKYLEANVGVIYLVEGKDTLKLMGSYAYKVRKHDNSALKMGEGLLGQVALERQTMVIQDVPADYLSVTSSLGEASVASILIAPIVFEGKLKAVIEVGSFHPFTELHVQWIDMVSEGIAIAINSGLAREKMAELLEESKHKSEVLEEQQEKLEKSNEALENQAKRLQKSQDELKAQSEELKTQTEEMVATNEELEEKTRALEKQKKDIEVKNEELKKSEKMLQQKADELMASGKYKSEFLSNMSHELRTPLNSLLILAQSLSENDEGNLTNEQVEEIKIIHQSGKNLLTLINDILDLSKVEAGKLTIEEEEIKIASLVNDIESVIKPLVKNNKLNFKIKIESHTESTFNSDSLRVEQILKNLLSNAVKFTNEGGEISLSIFHPKENVELNKKILSGKDVIAFAVQDNGIGIESGRKEEVFAAFRQIDGSINRKRGGTGLGLAISKELASILGGRIDLESEINKGSVFTLYLPVKGTGKKKNKDIEKILPHPNLGKTISKNKIQLKSHSILVIEDDISLSSILGKIIEENKMKPLLAHSAEDGMRLAKEHIPTAIILDKGLPDKDGLSLLEEFKKDQDTKYIPVHVMTGADIKKMALGKGAEGFLEKPIDKDQLTALIEMAAKKIEEPISELIVVEDDKLQQETIKKNISDEKINITFVESGKAAFEQLKRRRFHCMILDLNLPDMSGKELLEKMSNNEHIVLPAVIVYTAQDISLEDQKILSEYTPSIVLKTDEATKRLADEVRLFLDEVHEEEYREKQVEGEKYAIGEKPIEGNKILLVDDDMRNNIALGSYLRKRGLNVVTADNGELALERLEAEDDISLVLMDIMMPVMDGYTAMKKIRDNGHKNNIPIIALTAKAMAEDRQKCMEAGANDYLSKPIDPEKLFNLMRVWINKEGI